MKMTGGLDASPAAGAAGVALQQPPSSLKQRGPAETAVGAGPRKRPLDSGAPCMPSQRPRVDAAGVQGKGKLCDGAHSAQSRPPAGSPGTQAGLRSNPSPHGDLGTSAGAVASSAHAKALRMSQSGNLFGTAALRAVFPEQERTIAKNCSKVDVTVLAQSGGGLQQMCKVLLAPFYDQKLKVHTCFMTRLERLGAHLRVGVGCTVLVWRLPCGQVVAKKACICQGGCSYWFEPRWKVEQAAAPAAADASAPIEPPAAAAPQAAAKPQAEAASCPTAGPPQTVRIELASTHFSRNSRVQLPHDAARRLLAPCRKLAHRGLEPGSDGCPLLSAAWQLGLEQALAERGGAQPPRPTGATLQSCRCSSSERPAKWYIRHLSPWLRAQEAVPGDVLVLSVVAPLTSPAAVSAAKGTSEAAGGADAATAQLPSILFSLERAAVAAGAGAAAAAAVPQSGAGPSSGQPSDPSGGGTGTGVGRGRRRVSEGGYADRWESESESEEWLSGDGSSDDSSGSGDRRRRKRRGRSGGGASSSSDSDASGASPRSHGDGRAVEPGAGAPAPGAVERTDKAQHRTGRPGRRERRRMLQKHRGTGAVAVGGGSGSTAVPTNPPPPAVAHAPGGSAVAAAMAVATPSAGQGAGAGAATAAGLPQAPRAHARDVAETDEQHESMNGAPHATGATHTPAARADYGAAAVLAAAASAGVAANVAQAVGPALPAAAVRSCDRQRTSQATGSGLRTGPPGASASAAEAVAAATVAAAAPAAATVAADATHARQRPSRSSAGVGHAATCSTGTIVNVPPAPCAAAVAAAATEASPARAAAAAATGPDPSAAPSLVLQLGPPLSHLCLHPGAAQHPAAAAQPQQPGPARPLPPPPAQALSSREPSSGQTSPPLAAPPAHGALRSGSAGSPGSAGTSPGCPPRQLPALPAAPHAAMAAAGPSMPMLPPASRHPVIKVEPDTAGGPPGPIGPPPAPAHGQEEAQERRYAIRSGWQLCAPQREGLGPSAQDPGSEPADATAGAESSGTGPRSAPVSGSLGSGDTAEAEAEVEAAAEAEAAAPAARVDMNADRGSGSGGGGPSAGAAGALPAPHPAVHLAACTAPRRPPTGRPPTGDCRLGGHQPAAASLPACATAPAGQLPSWLRGWTARRGGRSAAARGAPAEAEAEEESGLPEQQGRSAAGGSEPGSLATVEVPDAAMAGAGSDASGSETGCAGGLRAAGGADGALVGSAGSLHGAGGGTRGGGGAVGACGAAGAGVPRSGANVQELGAGSVPGASGTETSGCGGRGPRAEARPQPPQAQPPSASAPQNQHANVPSRATSPGGDVASSNLQPAAAGGSGSAGPPPVAASVPDADAATGDGGRRLTPLSADVSDVGCMVGCMLQLMEQVAMGPGEARGTRRALRRLKAADKDSYLRVAYLTLCAAVRAGDEEEIREVFADMRMDASRAASGRAGQAAAGSEPGGSGGRRGRAGQEAEDEAAEDGEGGGADGSAKRQCSYW